MNPNSPGQINRARRWSVHPRMCLPGKRCTTTWRVFPESPQPCVQAAAAFYHGHWSMAHPRGDLAKCGRNVGAGTIVLSVLETPRGKPEEVIEELREAIPIQMVRC